MAGPRVAALEGAPSSPFPPSAATGGWCWDVCHAPLSSSLTALVRELLKEQVASRIAALTEELFQAAGSLSAEDGRVAEGEPPAPGPAGETGGACSSRPTALAQVGAAAP